MTLVRLGMTTACSSPRIALARALWIGASMTPRASTGSRHRSPAPRNPVPSIPRPYYDDHTEISLCPPHHFGYPTARHRTTLGLE